MNTAEFGAEVEVWTGSTQKAGEQNQVGNSTDLLQQYVDILLRCAEGGLVVHSAFHKLGLDVKILELLFELVHGRCNSFQVVGLQGFVQGFDDANHGLVDHLHFCLSIQARNNCIKPGCQSQVIQSLVLLSDRILLNKPLNVSILCPEAPTA